MHKSFQIEWRVSNNVLTRVGAAGGGNSPAAQLAGRAAAWPAAALPRRRCHAHTTQLLTCAAGRAKVANKTGKLQDSHWSPPQGVAGSASVRCAPGSQSRSIPDLVWHGLCLSTAVQGRAVQAPEGFGGEDQRAWAPASISGTSQTLDRALRGHTEATGPAAPAARAPGGAPGAWDGAGQVD